jgi:hypothetical protein
MADFTRRDFEQAKAKARDRIVGAPPDRRRGMGKTRVCKICGAEFEAESSTNVCGPACAAVRKRIDNGRRCKGK